MGHQEGKGSPMGCTKGRRGWTRLIRRVIEARTSADDVRAAGRPWDPLGCDRDKRRKERSHLLSYLPALAPEELPCVLNDLLI